jgi:hypothetical protein
LPGAATCISATPGMGQGAGAKQVKGADESHVPVFGVPAWTIYGGKANTWGFTDDGTIFTLRGGGGWLMTRKQYADFDLRLEIKMSKGADTGITFRNSRDVNPTTEINQIQFVDEAISRRWPAQDRTGGIWDVVAPSKEGVTRPTGEWNEVHIVAKGRRITVRINKVLVLDVNLDRYKHRAASKKGGRQVHPDLRRPKGHIGLQSWDGRVEFRNVRINELR